MKEEGNVPYAIYSPSKAGLNLDLDLVNLDDKRNSHAPYTQKFAAQARDVNKSKVAWPDRADRPDYVGY